MLFIFFLIKNETNEKIYKLSFIIVQNEYFLQNHHISLTNGDFKFGFDHSIEKLNLRKI